MSKTKYRMMNVLMLSVLVLTSVFCVANTAYGIGETTRGVSSDNDISSMSWQEISDLADQVAKDVAADSGKSEEYQAKYLGKEKTFEIKDGETPYTVTARIVGVAQDTLQDGGTCGFTFEIYKGMPEHSMNDIETTSGGYAFTAMKTWLEGLAFPSDLEPVPIRS